MSRRSLVEEDDKTEIELSPMIDCIFILLIFFIVTTVFVEESGLDVNKPEAGGSNSLESENIQIEITSDNKVMYNGQDIGIGGVQARIKQSLTRSSENPVLIVCSDKTDHGVFARVWGECKAAGAEKLTFNIAN